MSARDAESGSSTYKGGSGRAGGLGNGGIGGGMGGGGNSSGGFGGGAGRMGGMGNRTGMMTGNTMFGGMALGRPGGMAMNPGAWGMRPQAAVQQGPLGRPANPGLLGNPVPASSIPDERILSVEDVPAPQPSVIGYLPGWPGTGMWWGNQPNYMNNSGLNPPAAPAPAPPASVPKYQDRVPQEQNFPGNTYNGWGSSVGTVNPGRGWGGWNSGWN